MSWKAIDQLTPIRALNNPLKAVVRRCHLQEPLLVKLKDTDVGNRPFISVRF